MDETAFQILPVILLKDYGELVSKTISTEFGELKDSELSADTFSFYTSVSAVFSSKIEGEDIELDSFIKHKILDVKFLPDYTQKIDDLYDAYRFAQRTRLCEGAIEEAHVLTTAHILEKHRRGKLRTGNMFVMTPDGRIEYIACPPVKLRKELGKLYRDIDLLLNASLKVEEVFFFAAMIHLVFVKIHPFEDGNGRTARLLEKWFLAQKLGEKAWFIQSEKFYYKQHSAYYKNIRLLGLEYDVLDYRQSMPFLLMLPQALTLDPPL